MGYGYGPTDGTSYTYSLTGSYANADWGVYNAISNGGNEAGLWRTLTYNEWYYLRYSRTDANSKYGVAQVAGVNGCVFLPDSWTLPSGLSFRSGANGNYAQNTYSASEWSKMEANGAVFLPAAGGRGGTDVGSVGSYGLYWSSSAYDYYDAYYLYFDSYVVYTNYNNRNDGQSVRLVRGL